MMDERIVEGSGWKVERKGFMSANSRPSAFNPFN